MPRAKLNFGPCSIDGCERNSKSLGFCQYHYNKRRLEEKPDRAKAGLRGHPYYHLWFERKQANILCWEWTHFQYFIEGIGNKPEGNFILVRLDEAKPFGPDNFEWCEFLRKEETETNKEWWARKWKDARERKPDVEYDRNLKRSFGIGLDEYLEKFKNQNGVCAICEEEETSKSQSGTLRRLAVDHCHSSNKIRELLCSRCNKALGAIEDNVELLQKMIDYLNKHKETINGSRQS